MNIGMMGKKINQILYEMQKKVSFVLAVLIPFIVVTQVFLRYVFHHPLMGIEELLLFPTVWLYLLGGANASYERNHISCGILTLYIKRPITMSIFNLFKALLSLLISTWLAYWAYWYFVYSLSRWKLSDILYLPMFMAESAVFIGLFLMTLYTAYELIDNTKIVLNTLSNVNSLTKEEDKC